jgi:class 3 adenylate cyclase
MSELPSGTVTMLFTDIEGSTSLVRRLDDDYGAVLADYRRLLRAAVADAGGHEVDCRADELFAAFQRANDAVTAALSAQLALAAHGWQDDVRVLARMGLHTGEPAVEGGVYLGLDVHRAVRICAAGHGGQILLSQVTHDLVGSKMETRDLGAYSLAGLDRPERVYQLLAPGLRDGFPSLRAERSDGKGPRRPVRQSGPKRRTLAEAAWQVRRALPDTPAALQQPMAELGAALFIGDRAARGADKFLERVDEKRLARRKAGKQIASVERLRDRRSALGGLALDLPGKLDELRTASEIEARRKRVIGLTEEVDEALRDAARLLDALSFKLQRTRHRGIYRAASRYAVRYVDEAGREQLREFDTVADARAFRDVVRIAEKKQHEYLGVGVAMWYRGDDGRPRR